MLGRDESKAKKTDPLLSRNRLKRASGSITDDLLNFDMAESHGQHTGSIDDAPNGEVGPSHSQSDGGKSFVWMRNAFRAKPSNRSGGNDYTSIVVDSGASESVGSSRLVSNTPQSRGESGGTARKPSNFGDIRVFSSVGQILLPCVVQVEREGMARPIRIGIPRDLIDMGIPVLLSRDAMGNTGGINPVQRQ